MLSLDDFLAGQWDQAEQLVDEGLELSETHGYWSLGGRHVKALLAAARGGQARTLLVISEMNQWAAPRRIRASAWQPRALAAIGLGDFEEAYRQVSMVNPPGTLASHVPYVMWSTLDLVEAAVRTGRHEEAAAHVDAIRILPRTPARRSNTSASRSPSWWRPPGPPMTQRATARRWPGTCSLTCCPT